MMSNLKPKIRKLTCETDGLGDENDVKRKKSIKKEVLIQFDDRHTSYDLGAVSCELGLLWSGFPSFPRN